MRSHTLTNYSGEQFQIIDDIDEMDPAPELEALEFISNLEKDAWISIASLTRKLDILSYAEMESLLISMQERGLCDLISIAGIMHARAK